MTIKSSPARVLLLFAFSAVLVLLATAVFSPSLAYDPRTDIDVDALAGSPAQVAKAIWLKSEPGLATNVEAQRVSLVNGSSLLMSLLDDDPTCSAKVDLAVVTPEGETRVVSIRLWDYGMVLPWSYWPQGDGWKIMRSGSEVG